MNKHPTGAMAAVFTATVLFASPAFADHRPGNVVVMGGTISMTGHNMEPARRQFNGVKLYVEELNARGGLLGHKVELKIYDDKSNRRAVYKLYARLITEDKVDLLLGPYGNRFTDRAIIAMERYRQPFVSYATDSGLYHITRKYVFSIPTPYQPDRAKGQLHVAKKIGVKRIAILYRGFLRDRTMSLGAREWARKLGLKVVLAESYPKGQTDFTAVVQKIEASGAEAVIALANDNESIALIRQLRKSGIDLKMVGLLQQGRLQRFTKALGSAAEYVVGYASWWPDTVPGSPGKKEFVEKYLKRHGRKPTYLVSYGYAGMQIMAAAVKQAGSFDPEKIRAALADISVPTVRGVYKANEKGMSLIESIAFQIQNGRNRMVWPGNIAQAKVLAMPKWADRGSK